uniref:Uncharacterized protein n=1 Tax=Glossina brevipalpis TaxID=37001 RepID=A0A1A9WPI1_9MUSC
MGTQEAKHQHIFKLNRLYALKGNALLVVRSNVDVDRLLVLLAVVLVVLSQLTKYMIQFVEMYSYQENAINGNNQEFRCAFSFFSLAVAFETSNGDFKKEKPSIYFDKFLILNTSTNVINEFIEFFFECKVKDLFAGIVDKVLVKDVLTNVLTTAAV